MTGTGSAAGGGDGRRASSRAAGAGWVALGSLLALAAVAAGAFGAHGLRGRLEPEALQVFEVAVRYQMYHALALVLVGLLAGRSSGSLAPCGWAFAAGIGLFSGSLYALALTGSRDWGRVTPFGGTAFLLGWGLLALKTLWPPRGEARK